LQSAQRKQGEDHLAGPERKQAQNQSDALFHQASWHSDGRYNTTILSNHDVLPHPEESERAEMELL
jgi:hypothetical protein